MAGNNVDDARHLQVFKLEGRRNKMDFIRGFPGVASRFGIEGIVYEGAPRPEDGEARTEWDRLNKLALEKLRFYVSGRVDRVVTNGDDITARQYYERLARSRRDVSEHWSRERIVITHPTCEV